MKGDFSRDSFDPARHFTRVLLQQGRVLTDADFNEQAAIQQHFLRAFVVDLVGRRWRVGDGFAIGGATAEDFTIGAGRFYLGGMACENADACRYRTQPAGPAPADDGPGGGGDPGRAFVAYLEGWERSVSAAEEPSLRDPALGGVDPSVRAQIVWQVRRLSAAAARELAAPVAAALAARAAAGDDAGWAALRALKAAAAAFAADPGNGRRADALFDRLDTAAPRLTVRTAPPGAGANGAGGYRGAENRLYRIEIHRGGAASAATFEWSRDNGATVLPANGAVPVVERPPTGEHWIALEDGIEIQFALGGCYHAGDYWTVPARVATGGVLWPTEADGTAPRALPPQGLCRQRAALASVRKSGRAWRVTNHRPRRG
jgi:hypothetical protein